MNYAKSNDLSWKYKRFKELTDIGMRKFEFVEKAQILSRNKSLKLINGKTEKQIRE